MVELGYGSILLFHVVELVEQVLSEPRRAISEYRCRCRG
jgi:hypothetical protein